MIFPLPVHLDVPVIYSSSSSWQWLILLELFGFSVEGFVFEVIEGGWIAQVTCFKACHKNKSTQTLTYRGNIYCNVNQTKTAQIRLLRYAAANLKFAISVTHERIQSGYTGIDTNDSTAPRAWLDLVGSGWLWIDNIWSLLRLCAVGSVPHCARYCFYT